MPNWVLFFLVVVAALVGLAINTWWARSSADDSGGDEGFALNDLVTPITTLAVVLLAFIMVEGLSSYGRAREHVAAEARIIDQMDEAAARVDDVALGQETRAALVCYTEAVVHQEWPEMADGDRAAGVLVWTDALEELIARIDPDDPESGRLIDQDNARGAERLARLTEANPTIPDGLNVLMLVSVIVSVVAVAAFMKPRANRPLYLLVLAVFTFLMGGTLFMINDLDAPFSGLNKIEPGEMEARAFSIEENFAADYPDAELPCDNDGVPR